MKSPTMRLLLEDPTYALNIALVKSKSAVIKVRTQLETGALLGLEQ